MHLILDLNWIQKQQVSTPLLNTIIERHYWIFAEHLSFRVFDFSMRVLNMCQRKYFSYRCFSSFCIHSILIAVTHQEGRTLAQCDYTFSLKNTPRNFLKNTTRNFLVERLEDSEKFSVWNNVNEWIESWIEVRKKIDEEKGEIGEPLCAKMLLCMFVVPRY